MSGQKGTTYQRKLENIKRHSVIACWRHTYHMVRLANIARERRWSEEDMNERLIFGVCHERMRPEFRVRLRMVDRAAWIVASIAEDSEYIPMLFGK